MLAARLQNNPAVHVAAASYARATAVLERYAAPVFDLAVRFWMARVFFNSGRVKIADWNSTIYLFRDEYKVPVLPPEVAAVIGTTFELGMPIFLVLGLCARLAALPLIGMACVIQFVLGASNPDYDNVEHFYWLFLLTLIVVRGPGTLSLDWLVRRKFAEGGITSSR
jgi:putative oxidoreductase